MAAFALLVAPGCVDRAAQEQARRTERLVSDTTIPVQVALAATRELVETLEISGAITTAQDTIIGAKQPGRLVSVLIKDGDPVAAGQVIATQEATEALMRVRQAQAGVDAARAQLDQAQTDARVGPERSAVAVRAAESRLRQAEEQLALVRQGARDEERNQAQAAVDSARSNLEMAKKDFERVELLVQDGAAAAADLDRMRNAHQAALSQYESALETQRMMQTGARPEEVRSAEEAARQAREGVNDARALRRMDALYPQRVAAARAGLQSALEQLAMARQALEDCTIRAPFSGRISGRPAQVGTMLAGGAPVARLIGGDGAYFEAEVPELQIARVQVGKRVQVRLDALDGRTFSGVVSATNPLGDEVGRLFRVRVQLEGPLDEIKPGMFARGALELRRIPSATVVPTSAVVERDGVSAVFLVQGDKARRQVVIVGLSTDGVRQVKGVPPGAQVVVQGAGQLIDGATVRIEAPAADGQRIRGA